MKHDLHATLCLLLRQTSRINDHIALSLIADGIGSHTIADMKALVQDMNSLLGSIKSTGKAFTLEEL
jgi:hypothetical protein